MKKSNFTSLFKILFGFLLAFTILPANSMESINKDWTVATIMGSFSNKPSLKYYFEPQVRLINDSSIFNQLLLLGGVGYQISPHLLALLGPGWTITKTTQNTLIHENRLWEQLNWRIKNTTSLIINSRTRLEERKLTNASPIATRFRERIWVKIPIKNWQHYSFSCFDEIFLNLNHPLWVSPYFFEQNRLFMGITTQLSKSTSMDLGYLNQYTHSFKNELSNVLLLSFNVTL